IFKKHPRLISAFILSRPSNDTSNLIFSGPRRIVLVVKTFRKPICSQAHASHREDGCGDPSCSAGSNYSKHRKRRKHTSRNF
ncbi:hypothetical protein ACCS49_34495, partial [Rhizobium brockwellii]|uniref:hypothetical protein n=1 Tax=Rhizobium brockwellii TaxID=3019932 RepID=UPI003F94B92F